MSFIGGLVGSLFGADSEVTNSHATGNIDGDMSVGGLVGAAYSNDTVFNTNHATGQVVGGNDVGGLVGSLYGNRSVVTNSHATGNIDGNVSSGGLVGTSYGEQSRIETSFATGNVSGGMATGGLLGSIFGQETVVENTYALGEVVGDAQVGGLIGESYGSNTTISYSYSAGPVSGNTDVGGLVGLQFNATVFASFYDSQITGQSDIGNGEPRSTQQMRSGSTFLNAGWDFTNIWGINPTINSGYPYLQWQQVVPTPPAPTPIDEVGQAALIPDTRIQETTFEAPFVLEECNPAIASCINVSSRDTQYDVIYEAFDGENLVNQLKESAKVASSTYLLRDIAELLTHIKTNWDSSDVSAIYRISLEILTKFAAENDISLARLRTVNEWRNALQPVGYSYDEIVANNSWKKVSKNESIFHSVGRDPTQIEKYINPISGGEIVFDVSDPSSPKIIGDSINKGTYNYGSNPNSSEHIVLDILPWLLWGTGPNDPQTAGARIQVLLEAPKPTVILGNSLLRTISIRYPLLYAAISI